MLFDLRSRRRRGVVRVIYIFLALVMVGGLLLVGVGTSGGGLLNAFGGSSTSSSSTADQVVDKLVKKAEAAVKKNPDSASAWAALFKARYEAGTTGSSISSAGDITTSGIAKLKVASTAFQKYVSLAKQGPALVDSEIGAKVYQVLANWREEAGAWEYALQKIPTSEAAEQLKPYRCLALSAYAAGQTQKGDQAAAKALTLTPKLSRLTTKSDFAQAKKKPATAKTLVEENC